MSKKELNVFKYAEQILPLPEEYSKLSANVIKERIKTIKDELGDELVILGHNYQAEAVITHADFTGDSYGLSKIAAGITRARFVVFCGVIFMAESADILTTDKQQVIIPNLQACCPMAGMAELIQVKKAWNEITQSTAADNLVPITYMNSYADLKSFCGIHDGAVCTSSNAAKLFKWALKSDKKIFFFPDEHLGRNTALDLGIAPQELKIWNPWAEKSGGLTRKEIDQARVLLWAGECQVHQRFKPQDVTDARKNHPEATIIVHPECSREVVEMADSSGSTAQIIEAVKSAAAGSSWVIGTEQNLVAHLKKTHSDKNIILLGDKQRATCKAMSLTTAAHLLWVLEKIRDNEPLNIIKVASEIAANARQALETMIKVTSA